MSGTFQILNLLLNIASVIALVVVIYQIAKWGRRLLSFMELMDQLGHEEKRLRSRLNEWDNLVGDQEPEDRDL